jgi:DNA-binding CsgD family transcriptional regulator
MSCDPLVGELADLYRLASSAFIDEFPLEVLRRLQRWIDFDGATFGFGQPWNRTLRIATACVFHRDHVLLEDYAKLSHADPVTAAFLQGPRAPLVVDARVTYASASGELAKLIARHDLRQLLLFGDSARQEGPLRWVVLYRGTQRPFDAKAADRLSSVWQHISCSLELNCAQALDREEAHRASRALALVDAFGMFEAVDPAFHALIAREWPAEDASRLPRALVDAMAVGDRFAGRSTDFVFRRMGPHVLCRASRRDLGAGLTDREALVAEHYAQGRSHKEVAHLLHVSPHTVRTQLASAYRKLGVSDKAALARRLPGTARD